MVVLHTHSLDEAAAAIGSHESVVVVPVYNGFEDVVRCYDALFEHTPADVPVLVIDDQGADRRSVDLLDQIVDAITHTVVVLHRTENGGFVAACNDAFAATGSADVVLLNSDVVVGAEWHQRLCDAANSSSLIATASTLTNHGTILSVPDRNSPNDRLPDNMSPAEAARRVARTSLQLRPTIPTAVGHCVYIKRVVLDLVGGFDPAFGTGYGEEVDFSQRAVTMGFRHVCADDVFTFHRGGASFGAGAAPQQLANEAVVNARYPWYRNWVVRASTHRFSPLAQALMRARSALIGSSVAIDATCLGRTWMGTQSVTLESILSIAALSVPQLVTVLHGPTLTKQVAQLIDAIPNVERLLVHDVRHHLGAPFDIVYRPYQVNSLDELRWLKSQADRVVVNQLDLISWSNPSYFPSDHAWLSQRELTRLVLATVDGVAFISEAARREVEAEGLLPAGLPTRVVHCGTTSSFDDIDHHATAPDGVAAATPFLLALGASYHHKNRGFSIRLLQALRERGWAGSLVLAGPTPPRGNSLGMEALAGLIEPAVRDHVHTLGDVTEAEKRWLYEHAALSVYPSASEGFGLVPFESARHGVPVVSSRQGSLDEVLPSDLLTLDGYDVEAAAEVAWTLLHDETARTTQCTALVAQTERFTWNRTATAVLELFDEVLHRPPNSVEAIWGEGPAPAAVTERHVDVRPPTGTLIERQIQRLLGAEGLKRSAVPAGSRRQATARKSINWVRRTAERM